MSLILRVMVKAVDEQGNTLVECAQSDTAFPPVPHDLVGMCQLAKATLDGMLGHVRVQAFDRLDEAGRLLAEMARPEGEA